MVFLTIRLNAVRSCVLLIRFSSWVLRRSVARYAAADYLHELPLLLLAAVAGFSPVHRVGEERIDLCLKIVKNKLDYSLILFYNNLTNVW